MAYSKDFREKVIEYWEKGNNEEELYEAFGIYPSRINDWKKLLRETGSLEPQYKETRRSKIDMEILTEAVERKLDVVLAELAKIFECTDSAIFYALKRAKLSVKKQFTYTEQCYTEVIYYLLKLMIITIIFGIVNFVCVDESGLNHEYRRLYVRAKREVKVYDKKPEKDILRSIVMSIQPKPIFSRSGSSGNSWRKYRKIL